jgi:hypothetical protein
MERDPIYRRKLTPGFCCWTHKGLELTKVTIVLYGIGRKVMAR